MSRKLIAIALFLLAGLVSCVTYRPDGEPPTQSDAEPPADYDPVFIDQVVPFSENVEYHARAIVSSVDAHNPNSVRLRLHIADRNRAYLSGLRDKKNQKYWCEIVDTFQNKSIKVKNAKIREISEDDKRKTYISVVMDHSGSMGEDRAYTVQDAVASVIQNKNDDDELALVKYDNRAMTEVPLTANKETLLSGFQRNGLYGFGGMTAINNGIYEGLMQLKNLHKSDDKAVIVFTDGWDNSSTMTRDSVIRIARGMNALVCGVDFGTDINKDFMKAYADSTGGIYHHIYKTDEFNRVFEDLYKRLKNSYIIEYNPADYGLHKLRIKLCFPYDTLVADASFDNTPDIGSIGLMNVYFDFNKATIQKESEDAINSVYALLKAYPNMVIELRGHTDILNSTSDPDYNLKLSQKRADAVRQALVKMGIAANRILTRGMGDTEPVASNDTEEGRASNRRTEFVILKK